MLSFGIQAYAAATFQSGSGTTVVDGNNKTQQTESETHARLSFLAYETTDRPGWKRAERAVRYGLSAE